MTPATSDTPVHPLRYTDVVQTPPMEEISATPSAAGSGGPSANHHFGFFSISIEGFVIVSRLIVWRVGLRGHRVHFSFSAGCTRYFEPPWGSGWLALPPLIGIAFV